MDKQAILAIDEDGADPQRLDELARQLRTELLELDVTDVRPLRTGEAPPGTRALDVAAAGALVVSLGASAEVVGRLVGTIRKWLSRGADRTIEVSIDGNTITLTGASEEAQTRLLEAYLHNVVEGTGG